MGQGCACRGARGAIWDDAKHSHDEEELNAISWIEGHGPIRVLT